ncbi:MAG: uracil-DNA glycosylase, partial [Candidatus Heimdallarchaeota archaeon]|nr:uracil-DNA glycosylase [Candidatus Heimdallarchaeota archaeon]
IHRSMVVIGEVSNIKALCFIGEAPGKNEDEQGRPFVGRSGKLLDRMLEEVGIGRENVNVLNIVKCRPPNNRTPTNKEMRYCGDKWLVRQLQVLDPTMIVTLGSVALRYFFPDAKMTPAKGKPLFNEKLKSRFFPIFHPSYILRNGTKLIDDYTNDFRIIKKLVSTSVDKQKFVNSINPKAKNLKQQRLDNYF